MRIKFLSVIVSLLFVSFAITSCLDNDNAVIEYSSDATIHAFQLDSAKLGKLYNFSINQLTGEIYNQDSLPVGADTIINKTLIRTLTTASGYVVLLNKAGKDSLKDEKLQGLNTTDSFDLRNPIKVKVLATEGINLMYLGASESEYKKYTRIYTIKVNVHKQVADSLEWGKKPVAQNFAPAITGAQKSVILNNEIFVYAANPPVYIASTSNGGHWRSETISGLPFTGLTSLINFKNTLYATTGDGKVYQSTNGISWIVSTLSDDVVTLIAPIGDIITGIKKVNNKLTFCTTDGEKWIDGSLVPANFPYNNISAATYENNIGVSAVMVVGNTVGLTGDDLKNDTATVAWGYMKGQDWAELSTTSKSYCPKLINPSIMRYNDVFYVFGSDFNAFYTSVAALAWNKINKRFLLPEAIRGKASDYSMVVDDKNFIWIMRSTPNEVWRGRLNSLGFLYQAK